jgi:hypothetical protein
LEILEGHERRSVLSDSIEQPQQRFEQPALSRAANSDTRRVFPTPASPATNAIRAWPATASSRAESSSASSTERPTNVDLHTRIDIARNSSYGTSSYGTRIPIKRR